MKKNDEIDQLINSIDAWIKFAEQMLSSALGTSANFDAHQEMEHNDLSAVPDTVGFEDNSLHSDGLSNYQKIEDTDLDTDDNSLQTPIQP